MFSQLLSKLTPCFDDDKQEWQEVIHELSYPLPPKVCWYASSNLDFEPIKLIQNHQIYDKNHHILMMSDYSKKVIPILKKAYNQLGETPIYIPFDNLYGNIDNVKFEKKYRSFGEIIQMIPLTLWTLDEQEILNNSKNYHPSAANGVICDKYWHLVYILIETDNDKYIPVIFIGAENLLVLNEIIKKYEIAMHSFFAVRVGGKSGSWDATHNFHQGQLPKAIASLPIHLRPKYWGGDVHLVLPSSFTLQPNMTVPNFGFEGCQFYNTNWY